MTSILTLTDFEMTETCFGSWTWIENMIWNENENVTETQNRSEKTWKIWSLSAKKTGPDFLNDF